MTSPLIDISLPITPDGVVWPGAPRTEITWRRSMARGDRSNNSNLFMSCHTGTHVDAPLHFIDGGAAAEQLPLDALIGPAWVITCPEGPVIDANQLTRVWPNGSVERVLFKTANSTLWHEGQREFVENFCALDASAAAWLVDRGVRLVGIDYLSIQRYREPATVHQLLLGAEIVVLEGLDLSVVSPGHYELLCLPLKLAGADGAPARAVLRSFTNRCQAPIDQTL